MALFRWQICIQSLPQRFQLQKIVGLIMNYFAEFVLICALVTVTASPSFSAAIDANDQSINGVVTNITRCGEFTYVTFFCKKIFSFQFCKKYNF